MEKEDLLEHIVMVLEENRVEELRSFLEDFKYKDMIGMLNTDLLPSLVKHVTEEGARTDPELFECCERMIYDISELELPDSAVLDFIEWAEDSDPTRFIVILRGITSCLERRRNLNANFVSWSVDSVLRYVYDMNGPEDFKLEGEEKLLMEYDPLLRELVDVYGVVLEFYGRLWGRGLTGDKESITECEKKMCRSLIKLLGRPLLYTDLEERNNKSDTRSIGERIVELVLSSKEDHLAHLIGRMGSDETCDDFLMAEYTRSSLACFYYIIFHEGVGISMLPQTYSPLFLVENILKLCHSLLGFSHCMAQRKGLLLSLTLLDRIPDRALLYSATSSEVYSQFIEVLGGIMIYSKVKENRQVAVKVFRKLLFKFDSKGRHVILLNVQSVLPVNGFIGYLVTIVKDIVSECLGRTDHPDSEFFTKKPLLDLIDRFCQLEHGVETDLVQASDRIISSLNLLRYLFIRDSDRVSGIWERLDKTSKYLEDLKKGLILSRAHYELQKKDIREEPGDSNLSVRIGESCLPQMPREQKIQVLSNALNTIDLIDSLLSRLNECIQLHKTKPE